MGWGSFLGTVGMEMGAGPWAGIAGSGMDLLAGQNAKEMNRKSGVQFQNAMLENANAQTNLAYQKNADRISLRNKLLQQSADLKAANDQVAQYLGLPYTPTQADLVNDTMARSQLYTENVLKLATLDQSKTEANLIARLGGGDSGVARRDINRGIVDKFAPQLNKAMFDAEADTIASAKSRMGLDTTARANFNDFYGKPIADEFGRTLKLYDPNVSMPTNPYGDLYKAASQGAQGAEGDIAKALANMQKMLTTKTDGNDLSAGQELGKSLGIYTPPSTVTGSAGNSTVSNQPTTGIYGEKYYPNGTVGL